MVLKLHLVGTVLHFTGSNLADVKNTEPVTDSSQDCTYLTVKNTHMWKDW